MSDAEKSALDLDHLQALADAAKPGPWRSEIQAYAFPSAAVVPAGGSAEMGCNLLNGSETFSIADAAFIAAAREAVPALIARVREAEAENISVRIESAKQEARKIKWRECAKSAENERERWQDELCAELVRSQRMLDVMADEAAIIICERDELRAKITAHWHE